MEALKKSVFVACAEKRREVVERAVVVRFGVDGFSSFVFTKDGFFLTLLTEDDVEELALAGLPVEGVNCPVSKEGCREIQARFIDVPEFVEDSAITGKLTLMGCEVRSEVMWQRHNGKYFGERALKVRLPDGKSSLPWRIRIRDVLGREADYAVKHAAQGKVCNKCLSADHLYKDCPLFSCRRCSAQGHLARNCPTIGVAAHAEGYSLEAAEPLREAVQLPMEDTELTIVSEEALMENDSTTPVEVTISELPVNGIEQIADAGYVATGVAGDACAKRVLSTSESDGTRPFVTRHSKYKPNLNASTLKKSRLDPPPVVQQVDP